MGLASSPVPVGRHLPHAVGTPLLRSIVAFDQNLSRWWGVLQRFCLNCLKSEIFSAALLSFSLLSRLAWLVVHVLFFCSFSFLFARSLIASEISPLMLALVPTTQPLLGIVHVWWGRRRSKSLTMKVGHKMLVPEVGTASDQVALASGYGGEARAAMATDDLYMEGINIRRGFASEFMEHLEVSEAWHGLG